MYFAAAAGQLVFSIQSLGERKRGCIDVAKDTTTDYLCVGDIIIIICKKKKKNFPPFFPLPLEQVRRSSSSLISLVDLLSLSSSSSSQIVSLPYSSALLLYKEKEENKLPTIARAFSSSLLSSG